MVRAQLDFLFDPGYPTCLAKKGPSADVAQLAEQLICNQQVASSILAVSSVRLVVGRVSFRVVPACRVCGNWVGYLSGQREQTVNLPAYAFEGSNPSPTMLSDGAGFFVAVRE